MSSLTRQYLEAYLKTLEVKGKVLDIGGSARTLEGRVRVFEPEEYLIMDNGLEKNDENWNEPDIIWNISNTLEETESYGHYFDQIFMIEVSEYLINPLQALENIYWMLKKSGKFIASWHTIYPKHQPNDSDYLRYTDAGIEKLHELAGLKITRMIPRITHNKKLLEFYSEEQMRGTKHIDHNVIGWITEAIK